MTNPTPRALLRAAAAPMALLLCLVACTNDPPPTASPTQQGSASQSPAAADPPQPAERLLHSKIEHVVVFFLENHSFDNVLGRLCAQVRQGTLDRPGEGMACDGVTEGVNLVGQTVPLQRSPDIVPNVYHDVWSSRVAIHDGLMDGFERVGHCRPPEYQCFTQYYPSQINNLAGLAVQFGISDRTFELSRSTSWGGHFVLAAATLDGFLGHNPVYKGDPDREGVIGWGCDSFKVTVWRKSPEAKAQLVPSCVPYRKLDKEQFPYGGAFKPSPVKWVPTIFDRLQEAELPWRIYGGGGKTEVGLPGYGWTICPTFADCIFTEQHRNQVLAKDLVKDARKGKLPAFSIVTPSGLVSQHNGKSMIMGDDWIGRLVGAIEDGPDWSSTAIFITYDDCGCFYDHVNPLQYNADWGIRVPLVIASPWVRSGFTDSTPTSFAGILSFTEHVFGLRPLNDADGQAYGYWDAFDFEQEPVPPVRMTMRSVSPEVRDWLEAHPGDPDDPT